MKKIEDMTLEEIADWIVKTCLMFGAHPATAYKVAGAFVAGLPPKSLSTAACDLVVGGDRALPKLAQTPADGHPQISSGDRGLYGH